MEINAGTRRSKKHVLELFGEATQSHQVLLNSSELYFIFTVRKVGGLQAAASLVERMDSGKSGKMKRTKSNGSGGKKSVWKAVREESCVYVDG